MRKKFALNKNFILWTYKLHQRMAHIMWVISWSTYWDNNLLTPCSSNLLNLHESSCFPYYSRRKLIDRSYFGQFRSVTFEWMTISYIISIHISPVKWLKLFGFIFLEGAIGMESSSWSRSTKWIWPSNDIYIDLRKHKSLPLTGIVIGLNETLLSCARHFQSRFTSLNSKMVEWLWFLSLSVY